MSQPDCPFCLGKHDYEKSRICPNVKSGIVPSQNEEIPELYITQHDQVPPLWLLTVGFSRHGKTCYTAALTLMLESLYRVWPDSTWFPLDDYTRGVIRDTRRQAIEGIVPDHTKHLRPVFINMYDIPHFDDKCLVIYDPPGEIYEDNKNVGNEYSLQPLKRVKNIWFLVSLQALEDDHEKTINDLLNYYINGMQRLKLPLAGRNLIVVYTMADKILNQLSYAFPAEIQDYIVNDPFQNITNRNQSAPDIADVSISDYIDHMTVISEMLEKYTVEKVPGGGAFVKLARRSGMGLYFSINSALGSDPVDGKMQQDATRYRVLDPFLWALYLNKGPGKQLSIKLVIDGSSESDIAYQKLGVIDLFNDLSEAGNVTTYLLGQARHVSVENQPPPTKKPTISRTRLIGPILENAKDDSVWVVLTTGRIEDLMDFAKPEWHSRLLLVNIGDEEFQEWPNQVIIRPNDPHTIIWDEFKKLFVNSKPGVSK